MHPHDRRPGARSGAWGRACAALALSLALNAGGLVAVAGSGALSYLGRAAAPSAPVALSPLAAAAWEANRRVDPAPAPAHPAAPKPALAEPEAAPPRRPAPPAGQVVDVAPSPDPRRPEQARFLAERDGRVERETRSRLTGTGRWETALPRPAAGAKGRGGIAEPGEEGRGEEREEGRVGATAAPTSTSTPTPTSTPTATSTATSTATPAAALPSAPVSAARALLTRGDGEGGLRRAGAWDPRLMPVGAPLDGPAAGGPSETVPSSVAEGDETRLNTRRFRFAEFYARVHAAIRREWDPNRAWDARDPHDRLLGRRTRNARFDILVEPDGRLRDVRLVESSGLGFLDRECERAIRAAAPFPNPPAALVGPDGAVELRGWVLSFDFAPRGALEALRR